MPPAPRPVVHLELHTGDLPGASAFYSELCGWRPERIHAAAGRISRSSWAGGFGGGIVECETPQPMWLPYVEVPEITAATERAASSAPPCCSARARARRAGAASSRPRPAARSPSGSRSAEYAPAMASGTVLVVGSINVDSS